MKIVFHIILYILCALILISTALVFFGVSNTQDTQLGWTLTSQDINRAKKLLHEGSKTKPDEIGTIELSLADLNLIANYLLNRFSNSAVQVSLKPNHMKFEVTATLPENPLGNFLNITLRLGNVNNNPLPTITKFKAGKLLLPANISGFFIKFIIKHTSLNDYFLFATNSIKTVHIESDKITISYFSNFESLLQARNILTSSSAEKNLTIYRQKIADVIATHDPKWLLSLAELLKPLFELALQRSTLNTAIQENRLVIMVANDYINRREIAPFMPSSSKLNQSQYYLTYMYKRYDLAQHFIASAALTASVNPELAQVIGEEKELSDSQGGSGFSFIDLAADKAGTRFAELAIGSPESARRLQQAMVKIKDYSAFMPDPRDLPEKMAQAEFKSRFGSINSPAYLQLTKEIDARIAATPIYQLDRNLGHTY